MITIEKILTAVCTEYGIGREKLSSYCHEQYMDARCIAVQLCMEYKKTRNAMRDMINISLEQINYASKRFVKRMGNAEFYSRYTSVSKTLQKGGKACI